MALSAGIIGTQWGVVHVYALRKAGVDVRVLSGQDPQKTAQAAREHGVPYATTDLDDLDDLDVVVIATPTSTHRGLVERFAGHRMICEKPLFGPQAAGDVVPEQLFVNYAFPFLETAGACRKWLREGPLDAVSIETRVMLPEERTPLEWFAELACHPLAWVTQFVGSDVGVAEIVTSANHLQLLFWAGGVGAMTLRVVRGGDPGIEHHVHFERGAEARTVHGLYRPGAPWRFRLTEASGQILLDEGGASDAWTEANERAVAAMVAAFENPEAAPDPRLVNAKSGRTVDRLLTEALG